MAGFTGTPSPQILAWLDQMEATKAELQGERI
jgi:hypothetical protein